jgi:hypothetical protein
VPLAYSRGCRSRCRTGFDGQIDCRVDCRELAPGVVVAGRRGSRRDVLTQDEVRNFSNGECHYYPHGGFDCPAEAAHEIFLGLSRHTAVGLTLRLVEGLSRETSATKTPSAH